MSDAETLHPIIDHVFAALELETENPAYAAEDIEALEHALEDIVDEEECVRVFAGLVEWLDMLHGNGSFEARDQLLDVVHAFADARACLEAPPLGHGESDAVEVKESSGWSAFAGARSQPVLQEKASGGMSLLALRAGG